MTTIASDPEQLALSAPLADAARLQELVVDLVSGKAAWSSAARAVLDAAIDFHVETIESFEASFGSGTGWWCLPMLPTERLFPFVTSPVYGDEYRPIVNTADDGPPEWVSFFAAGGKVRCVAPAEKALSIRQAVAYYFEERSKEVVDDAVFTAFVQLVGQRSDGSWLTVYTELDEAAHNLQQVHDTLDFPASTAAARVQRPRRDGWGVWLYEVRSGEHILAEYSPVHDAVGRRQLARALNGGRVRHYDFTDDGTLRRLRADRMAAGLAAAMSRGEREQHATPTKPVVL